MGTQELLNFDGIAFAEEITGKSYKNDKGTDLLGIAMLMANNKAKLKHLQDMKDTTMSCSLEEYLAVVDALGFELVLDLPFTAPGWNKEDSPVNEHFFVFAHRDGILLNFDTYQGNRVNGGHFCYCWKPTVEKIDYRIISCGMFYENESDGMYWGGDHDCREALKHKIETLRSHGEFMKKWPADSNIFLWLLHYRDTKVEGYDYRAITKERITMLPVWVQDMIGEHN